jgi:hypothetical protein
VGLVAEAMEEQRGEVVMVRHHCGHLVVSQVACLGQSMVGGGVEFIKNNYCCSQVELRGSVQQFYHINRALEFQKGAQYKLGWGLVDEVHCWKESTCQSPLVPLV